MLERQYRLEWHFGIQSQPPPPLVPLHNPFELYEEACVEFYGESSSDPLGKGKNLSTRSTLRMRRTSRLVRSSMAMMMVMTTAMMWTTRSSCFFHVAYPFWHLMPKGEC